MLLRVISKVPPVGSLQEFALRELVLIQGEIEHARLTVTAQIAVNAEAGIKAYADYLKVAFPYLKTSQQREYTDIMKMIEREMNMYKNGIPIAPASVPTKPRSQLREKSDKTALARANRLCKKIGASI